MSARLALPSLRTAISRPLQAARIARAYSTRAPRSGMGEGELTIFKKLNDKFPGTQLDVQDVSGE